MNIMAVALVFLMTIAVSAAMGVVVWGLLLEARSNREWHDRGLAR